MDAKGYALALFNRVRLRLALVVGRAVVLRSDDTTRLQTLQLQGLKGEVRDGVERVQQYGFTSRPIDGAEAVPVFVGGDRAHGVVVAVDDRRYRLLGMAQGEVALYDDLGHKVLLTRAGIVIEGGGDVLVIRDTPKVRIEAELEVTGKATLADDLELAGDAQVGGNVAAAGDVSAAGEVTDESGTAASLAAMRLTYDLHYHPVPGYPNTEPPVPPLMS